jgi:UPF0755 protein
MRKKIIFIFLGISLVAAFLLKDKLTLLWYATSSTANKNEISFYISKKLNVEELAIELLKNGIVSEVKSVLVLGEYKKLNPNNIALGKYIIQPKTSIRSLLNGFRLNNRGNGNAEVEVDVVVPNVRFLADLAGKLSAKTMIDSSEFVGMIEDSRVLNKYSFTKEQLPALFLPNTYKMYFDTDASQFLDRMAKEFKNYWTTDRIAALQKVGLKSPSEAVTLASIVYSEQSKVPSEWPIIAGLYLNRIHQGIPLQSDPTFKFCWGKQLDTVQRLLNVHRNIDCAYNTYLIKGLPPGPICIPPVEVVNAVLNPAKHNYVFMVAEPSYAGKHHFAKDYSEHYAHAKIFQNWLAGELAKK